MKLPIVTWERYGGYECSSKGDKTYSAFYARFADGESIEEKYQFDVKGYRGLGYKLLECKKLPCLRDITDGERWLEYLSLWFDWSFANQKKLIELRIKCHTKGDCLSDMFGRTSLNQAHALADVLNSDIFRNKFIQWAEKTGYHF